MQKAKLYKYYLTGFNLFICILMLNSFVLNKHFSVDDYSIYYHQNDSVGINIGVSARPIGGAVYALLNICKINSVESQIFWGLMFVFLLAWAISRSSIEIIKSIKSDVDVLKIVLINGSIMLLFLNAFLSELFYFTAAYTQWMVAIIGAVYAAIYIGKEKNLLKNWILGTLFLIMTAGTYQLFIAQYAYIVMILIFIHETGKITPKSVSAIFRAIMSAFTAVAINILCSKMLTQLGLGTGNTRINIDLFKTSELIAEIISSQKTIWIDGLGIYPCYLLGIVLFFMLFLLYLIMYKKKAKIQEYLFTIAVLISGQCVIYLTQFAQGFVWPAPRILYPIFGTYTVCILMIYLNICDSKIFYKKTSAILIFLTSIFLIIGSGKLNRIAIDIIISNKLTQHYVKQINERIYDYEQKNNIKISKVGFCNDKYVSFRYYEFISNSSYAGNLCENPFVREWSNITSLNYYSNRNYSKVDVPADILEYYEKRNWDEVNWNEQLYFDNDAVYICVF